MDPHQQPTEKDNTAPQPAADQNNVPHHLSDDYVPQTIPGKAQLDNIVGKAIGGTVIPSDIRTSDMPSLRDSEPNPEPNVKATTTSQSSLKLQPPKSHLLQEQTPPLSPKDDKPATLKAVDESTDSAKVADDSEITEQIEESIPGFYPTKTRVGWLEMYKRIDGPSNEFRDKSIWMEDFASSAFFGSFWHNAAALFVIPIICFFTFKIGGGFVSLVLIIAFGATYYKNSVRRFRRNARDDITRELIKGALENDAETTEWINNFLDKFWLIYEPVLSASIVHTVDSILVDNTPSFLDAIRLTTFTLGTKAPRVENIKAFPRTDPDIVLMDWRLSFTPTDTEDMTPRQLRTQINPKVCLSVILAKGLVNTTILLEDMSFTGFIRLKLKLMSNFPHVKTIDFCFLDPPAIDYVLKPLGGFDIAHIPGLQAFIRDQIHGTLGPMMYAPNVYTLDLEQIMTGGASLTAAAGVLQFTLYNAKDLKNSEIVGIPDPYCKIRLGNRPPLAITDVQQDNLNPVWNETISILLNNLNEVVSIEILDKDNVRKDRPIGQANFDLKSLEDEPIQDDVWCKVLRNGKERGNVRIRLAWFPIQTPELGEDGQELPLIESNSGILHLSIAQAKDIARSGKFKSQCVVYLNGQNIHQTKKVRGANPSWGSDVDSFVTDLQGAVIAIDVVSEDRVIGSYSDLASNLLQNTTDKVDWFSLKGAESVGKLKLNAVWKPILMGTEVDPTAYRAPIGVVRIQMFAGRDLKNVEIASESDPYVVISGDRGVARGKTKTINNNLNPVWNEIFYITVNSMKQLFDLEVFDFQKVTKDRPIGSTSFTVSEIIEELPDNQGYVARPVIRKWAPLKLKDGSMKGEIDYEISFFPTLRLAEEATETDKASASASPKVEKAHTPTNEAVEGTPVQTANAADQSTDSENPVAASVETANAADQSTDSEGPVAASTETTPVTPPPGTYFKSEALDYDSGLLSTHLISAQLERTRSYCEFYIDSDSYQYRSQSHKSRNPKWSEIADIFVKELEFAKIVIIVKEKTNSDNDPIIGVFSEHIRYLLDNTPDEGADYDIKDKHGVVGTLHLKFEFTPIIIELLPKERLDNMGNLTITIVRAKNLMAADRSGLSDPFVVFKVNDKEAHKSEVVKKNLNPEFNETFTIPINSRAEDEVTFEVFDWNQVQTAKSLGTGSIDIKNIQLVLPNEYLMPLKNKHNKGEIEFRVKFLPEFLSSSKKPGFATSFLGGGLNVGLAGVEAVSNVGHGALDVTGNVGKGAAKGVAAVGKGVGHVGKGIGKGVFGGLHAGVSILGIHHHKDKSGSKSIKSESRASIESSHADLPDSMKPHEITESSSSRLHFPDSMKPHNIMHSMGNLVNHQNKEGEKNGKSESIRASRSEGSLPGSSPAPRTSVGSIRSRTSMVFDTGEVVGEPGSLTIQIIEADGLTGVDKSGTSDPYVKVSIGNKSIHKTKVKKENLAPNWNETATINNITGHPVTINFLVRDHNTIGSDKVLGDFNLRLWEYIQPQSEAHNGEYSADFWAPLSGTGGRIHLALQFEPNREGSSSVKMRRSLFGRK
ncbi:hypothetical protein BGZ76_004991 [Entomortierella beljakovae]|nr:hypothetical protein BGZ76_004991 [Entomortierella beljakovae]